MYSVSGSCLTVDMFADGMAGNPQVRREMLRCNL